MKPTKILGFIFVLLFAVVAGLIAYVLGNVNQIVKDSIETVGPQITQTHVGIRDVDIKLLKGKGQLSHFVVGNPADFSSDYLLKWDSIDLELDTKTIRSDVVVIKNIAVKGMAINVEQNGLSTNIQTLMKNVRGKSDSVASNRSKAGKKKGDKNTKTSPSDKQVAETEGKAKGDSVKLALEQMHFSASTIELTSEWGAYTLSLPGFELSGLGTRENGLTPKELGRAILKPLLRQVEKEVAAQLKTASKEKFDQVKEKLKESAASQKEKLRSKLNDGKSALGEKKDQLEDKLKEQLDSKDIEESLRKLFR